MPPRRRAGGKPPLWQALARESQTLQLLGRKISREQQENLVRGHLMQNLITGRDDAVQSAKRLGADRRISMWQAKSQVGMVVLQAPPVPKILHEVPILPPLKEEEQEVEDDFR